MAFYMQQLSMSTCIRHDFSETTLFFVVVFFIIEVCITSKYFTLSYLLQYTWIIEKIEHILNDIQ